MPADRTVYTGDILFNESHPIMWAGPVANWIKACDYILGLDVETIVSGHGPISEKSGVRNLKRYFEYIRDEAKKRFEAGMGWEEAGRDMALDAFRGWADEERIVANVFALYREFGAELPAVSGPGLFAAMERYRRHRHEHRH